MTDALRQIQTIAVAALQQHRPLSEILTGVFDGPPVRAAYPYISISGGLATDWGTKTEVGREIRLALNIWDDGEEPARLHDVMGHAEDALAAIGGDAGEWRVVSNIFLRSLIARDPAGPWAGLIEQRIRLLRRAL